LKRFVTAPLALILALVFAASAPAMTYTGCVKTLLGEPGDDDAYNYASEVYVQTGIWPTNSYPIYSTRVWYGSTKLKMTWEYDNNGVVLAYATGRCVANYAGGPPAHDAMGWPPPTGW
jgi:hypothetical protein